jgi:Uma2 family endonuclease
VGSDTATRLDRKVQAYLAHGAKEVWVLYPETRHAWVYVDRAQSARREEFSIHSELLPGIEIPFDRFL